MIRLKPRTNRKDDFYNWYLRDARLDANYTAVELADESEIPKPTIWAYERLRAFPSPANAKKIALLLGKKANEIFPKYLREVVSEVRAIRKDSEESVQNNGDSTVSLEDISEDSIPSARDNPVQEISYLELKPRLERVLGSLDEEEEKAIRMKYGIDENPCTFKEVGDAMGFSKQWAEKLIKRCLKKLQSSERARELAGFIE